MEVYEIENREDALILMVHLLRDYEVEGFVSEAGTMTLEYKTGAGQWFFVCENLDIQPPKVKQIESLIEDPDTGEPIVKTYIFGGPPEHRLLDSSLSKTAVHGYWCNAQGPLFPVELKDTIYPLLSDSPSEDKAFEVPEDWEKKKHLLLFGWFGLLYYPFYDSDWMKNLRNKVCSWLSEEDYVKLASLWAAKTGRSQNIEFLGQFADELFDNVVHKASCVPRVDEAKFKYLLRTAIAEDAATYTADCVTSQVADVIGY